MQLDLKIIILIHVMFVISTIKIKIFLGDIQTYEKPKLYLLWKE